MYTGIQCDIQALRCPTVQAVPASVHIGFCVFMSASTTDRPVFVAFPCGFVSFLRFGKGGMGMKNVGAENVLTGEKGRTVHGMLVEELADSKECASLLERLAPASDAAKELRH